MMIIVVVFFFVNWKEIFKFKTHNEIANFPAQFSLGTVSDGFSNTESREVPINGNVYDFSVDDNTTDKSHVLNILKYLMAKNNIKKFLACFLFY